MVSALEDFELTWKDLNDEVKSLLLGADLTGLTEGRLQTKLHEMIAPYSASLRTAALENLQQQESLYLDPAQFTEKIGKQYCSDITIDGPQAGNFYMEKQDDMACGQHSANGMVGGNLFSLRYFATHKVEKKGEDASMVEVYEAEMLLNGTEPEILRGALEKKGIETHLYHPMPIMDNLGNLKLDQKQILVLDRLNTDRLIIQSDNYSDNFGKSHYVAFRKKKRSWPREDQWVLLDSRLSTQREISPSEYLLENSATNFSAIWPKKSLTAVK